MMSRMYNQCEQLMNNTEIALIYLDNDMCIRLVTSDVENIIPIRKSDAGKRIFELAEDDNLYDFAKKVELVLFEKRDYEYEFVDSFNRLWEVSIKPYLNSNKEFEGAVARFQIMAFQSEKIQPSLKVMEKVQNPGIEVEEVEASNKLTYMKQQDPLTKLYNKDAVKRIINRYLQKNQRKETNILYVIDIDEFKRTKEVYGHLYGDYILEELASELRDMFSTTDVIGRLEEDKFIVFVKNVEKYAMVSFIAESILDMIKEKSSKKSAKANVSVSIGISMTPSDGKTYDELYDKANIALSYVKNNGKSSFEIYNEKENRYINIQIDKEILIKENDENKTEHMMSPYVEKRLSDFALEVISGSKSFEESIHIIFEEIGKYYSLGRINIIETDIKTGKLKISNEWCNEGVEPSHGALLFIANAYWKWYTSEFQQQIIINFEDITKEKLPKKIREAFQILDVKAFLQCALYDGKQFVGCVNFANCGDAYKWSQSEIDTLMTITKIIGIYLLRFRNQQQLSNELFYTQAMLNNQMLLNYLIKKDTYEIQYVSECAGKKYQNIKLGQLCYKAIMNRKKPCDICPIKGLKEKEQRYSVESYDERFQAWYSTTASMVESNEGEEMYLLCRSDVTGFLDRVKAIDPLTGILTMTKFEAEVMKKFACLNQDQKSAVIYLDVDKFKYLNGEYGYEIGDRVLKFVSKTISEQLLGGELFCRVTGDNFILFLQDMDEETLLSRFNEMILNTVEKVRKSINRLNIVISSGICFVEDDKVFSSVLDKANLAKKTKKGYHKSICVVYDDEFKSQMEKEKEIERQMLEALKNREFIVYYQPKINLVNHEIIGAEALVRWKTSAGVIRNPIEFIPVFENNGFILELDFYVYEEVFRKLREWMDQGKKPMLISVNVSRLHIDDTKFLSKLDALVEKYQIPTCYVEIELTESAVFNNMEKLLEVFYNLRKRGFVISIDDFGSGFSSLNLLKNLPVDVLKLDKEFFLKNSMTGRNKVVILNIIQLAKGLGLEVISEGVETQEQAEFLEKCGCDMAQGYLFYKPLQVEEFEKLLL